MPSEGLTMLGQLFGRNRLHLVKDGCVIIEENGKQASLKKMQIDGVGTTAVALCFDKAGHNTPFSDWHSVRKACDAILFCRLENDGYILCFDLKSGQPSKKDYIDQLKSAQCFVDYTVSILQNFHQLDCRHWQRRFFVFHDASKSSIRKESGKLPLLNNNPNQPWIYPVSNGERIYLRKLLGRPQ